MRAESALIVAAVILLLWPRKSQASVYGSIATTSDGHRIDFSNIDLSSAFAPLDLSGMGVEPWDSVSVPTVSTNIGFEWGAWGSEFEPAGAQVDWILTDGPDWSDTMPAPDTVTKDVAQMNVAAFLATLKVSEGTATQTDPYRTVMGYGHTLQSLADHPYFTGEWTGAQFFLKGDVNHEHPYWSTAAGAYQIIRKTWAYEKEKLSLSDFSPASQDKAAIELIRERGALDDVMAGRFTTALQKCATIWASLPGATYGQSTHSMQTVLAAYQTNGGTVVS